MTISRKRKGSFGSYDIEDEDVIAERKQLHAAARSLAYQHRIRYLDSRSRSNEYTRLRSRGVKRLAAFVASYDKMPARKNKPKGIGATYRAKKRAANYGATANFNKALVAAVKKAESKSHETYYSDFGILFNSNADQATGTFTPGGFQATSGAKAGTAASVFGSPSTAHVINLSAQVQTGNGGQNGYRRGQYVNPVGFQWWCRGFLQNMTNQHTFHFCVARYKGASSTPQAGVYPGVYQFANLALFEPGNFGPSYGSFNNANQEFMSGSRFNRDAWDIKMHKTYRVNPPVGIECSNPAGVYRVPVKFDGYMKFKENTWDYILSMGTSLKGGDYFLIMWQESSEPAASTVAGAPQPWQFMQLNMEVSFKDA